MSHADSIVVIGAGTMGSGIAYAAASAGIAATVVDVHAPALEKARGYHEKTVARSVEKGRLLEPDGKALLGRVGYEPDLEKAVKGAAFVVEAASERVDLKKQLFKTMAGLAAGDAVLATNTSSISITEIASAVGRDADRVIGMHFFNPVPVMKLVEVIKGLATSEATLDRTIALAKAMGKTADQRGVLRVDGGRREARGHRRDHEARLQLPDGAAAACRLHRPRRLPRHHDGAAPRTRRSEVLPVPAASATGDRGAAR
jgi:3-hydroxyacyl-CoA dehydrogenase